jgi:hypothetical protein
MNEAEVRRLTAEMIANALRALVKQAEVNDLTHLMILIQRALDEAELQSREQSTAAIKKRRPRNARTQ